MRHLILRLIVTLLTFSASVGLDQLLNAKQKPAVRTAPAVPYDTVGMVPATPHFVFRGTPGPLTEPRIICDYDPNKFYPVSSLYVISQKPKTFGDYDVYFEILPEANDKVSVSIANLGGDETPRTEFALITDRRLFFVTSQTSDGFEYRFDGEFLRRGVLYEAPEGKAVLKGTLTKSKNGHTVTEWALRFGIVYDGC